MNTDVCKPFGDIYFTEKWICVSLQASLEFDNFKFCLQSCIFKWISRLNSLFFEDGYWRFWKASQDPPKHKALRNDNEP
jgi:hypothetical protein